MKSNIPYGYKIHLYTRSLTDEGFKGFDIDFLMEGENEAKGRKKANQLQPERATAPSERSFIMKSRRLVNQA
ncbi:hypothetical protein M3650_01020 [Paenibacillus sp. MER TA 81-3]|uniref:hypothetical protein n=1 Tax=Paenibacillus sp. MER TA 81-3 TaxID=2939573 RepID=UPI00203AA7A6|nr:hypothetical protein [Paenibacillus sp. MER TA 81-3]MCM3337262.1 hypothetical protein [Paenibacillus sp. MER TA 81-3]